MNDTATPTKTRATVVQGLTPIQRAFEARKLNERCAPRQIVVDPSLPAGQWYVVRALAPAERALLEKQGT
jgi:hypothetical protein